MFEINQLVADFVDAPAPMAKNYWVRVYDEMTVHTQGKEPTKLIGTRRPYEDAGIQKYRLDSFEPITKDAINRAITNLQRLFSNANYRLVVDPEVTPYIQGNNFADKDFMSFIASDVVRRMIEDANGCLVYWPTGAGLTVKTERIELVPMLVLSKTIKIADQNAIAWLSTEKSLVSVGKRAERTGEVYYIAARSGFYKMVQYGKKSDNLFRALTVYLQDFDYAPYVVLGGEPIQVQDDKGNQIDYFESYFNTYLPSANEAIRQFSDHQGIMVTSAFPIREMEHIECNATGCKNGKVYDEKTESFHTCGTCHGKGYIAPPSPFGVLVRPPARMGEERKDIPSLRYITPDVGIIEYNGNHWRQLLKDAEKALNLIFIDEAQSGIAKSIDREDKEAAIDRIGSNVYNNIVRNSLIIITDMLTLGTGMEPHVHLPPTFRIKSEQEVIEELTQLKKDGAPDFIIAEATRELMQRRYGNDPEMLRMVELLAEFDTFFALSTSEKRDLFASGGMDEQEYLFSVHAPKYLRVISKQDDFMALRSEQVLERLNALMQSVINRRPVDGTLDA
jgi:hypothetical protein